MSQYITKEPIDIFQYWKDVHDSETGAVVVFSGEIRGTGKGKQVAWLEYESYESMAEKVIADIVARANEKWPLNKVVCLHRIGRLEITDCAILVITCSAHRDAAYKANRYIVDEVKHMAPIWKNEIFTDGTHAWGANCEGCEHSYHQNPDIQHHHRHSH